MRFPMSLRWSSYVAPKLPKGGSKTQNGRFPSKIALRLKKVCYKVYLYENCHRQSYKTFNIHWPNYRCKNNWWRRSLLPEILDQTDRVGAKLPIFDLFARSSSAVIPYEKSSINTDRKSTTRFPMSPKGDSKCKTADFRLKSHFGESLLHTIFFVWKLSATKL